MDKSRIYNHIRHAAIVMYLLMATTCFIISVILMLERTISFLGLEKLLPLLIERIGLLSYDNTLVTASILFMLLYGIPHFLTAIFAWARARIAIRFGIVSSSMLLILSIGLVILFPNQFFSYFFLFYSLDELIISIFWRKYYYISSFYFNPDSYFNIGLRKDSVVIYYSPDNEFVRKQAYEVANEMECDLIEVKEVMTEPDYTRYKSMHFICHIKDLTTNSLFKEYASSLNLKNKRLYLEVISNKEESTEKIILHAPKNFRHIYNIYIDTMRRGEIVNREKR